MGAIQFIENLDRTTLTITDDEFEKHVIEAVSAIAEKHQATSPTIKQQPVFNEKIGLPRPGEPASRPSYDGQDAPRRSTSSSDGNDNAPISGILKTIQRPLSTIGRIFSDDGGPSTGPGTAPRAPAPASDRLSPRQSREEGREAGQRPSSRHALSAEEAAARQASAEVAEAQRLHRAEHSNVVETLAGMFPDLDKDIISDVVYQKEGRYVKHLSSFGASQSFSFTMLTVTELDWRLMHALHCLHSDVLNTITHPAFLLYLCHFVSPCPVT